MEFLFLWLISTNHKNIGTMYLNFRLIRGLTGTRLRIIIRIELSQPGSIILDESIYNIVITSHAIIIIFFMIIPALIGGFGNWLIPIFNKRIDIVYPRLNNLRF